MPARQPLTYLEGVVVPESVVADHCVPGNLMKDPGAAVVLDHVLLIGYIAHVPIRPDALAPVVVNEVASPSQKIRAGLTADNLGAPSVVIWIEMTGVVEGYLVTFDEDIVPGPT